MALDLDTTEGGVRIHELTDGTIGTGVSVGAPEGAGGVESEAGCVIDMDNDGNLDLVFGDGAAGALKWVRRIGPEPSHFDWSKAHLIDDALPTTGIGPAVCKDVNADSFADVVVSTPSSPGTLVIYLSMANGYTFEKSTLSTGLTELSALAGKAAGDFNGDGLIDIVLFAGRTTGSTQGRIVMLLNTGSATVPFSTAFGHMVALNGTASLGGSNGTWGAVVAGNLNGAGQDDIWVIGMDGIVHLMVGGGFTGGGFQPPVEAGSFSATLGHVNAGVFDVNDDGLLDLGVASASSSDSNTLRVFLGTGAGALDEIPTFSISSVGPWVAWPVFPYPLPPPPSPADGTVSLYHGYDLTAARVTVLSPGSYINSTAANIANDSIRSVRVGDDVGVILCRDAGYKLDCSTFLEDDNDVTDEDVGKGTTSVVVLRKECAPPEADEIVLYRDPDFSGLCLPMLTGGYGDRAFMGLPDNFLSSFRAGADVEVEVCTDGHLGGTCDTFVGDTNLEETSIGAYAASSIKVMKLVTLKGNLQVSSCGNPDVDLDGDCLNDDREDELAAAFAPLFVFHPDETARRRDVGGVSGLEEPITPFQVRPDGCAGTGCSPPYNVQIVYVQAMIEDSGYPSGTGCGGFDEHGGDNDNVVMVVSPPAVADHMGGKVWRLWSTRIRLSGGNVAWGPYTTTAKFDDPNLEMRGARTYVYNSLGKHHQYYHGGNWGDSPYSEVPFWDDCGDLVTAGAVIDPDLTSVKFGLGYNNVGERGRDAHPTSRFVGPFNEYNELFSFSECAGGAGAWSPEFFCSGSEPMEKKWLK